MGQGVHQVEPPTCLHPTPQAVRNYDDLETMACPPKYRALNTFYKYYSGEAKAPFPTLFSEWVGACSGSRTGVQMTVTRCSVH